MNLFKDLDSELKLLYMNTQFYKMTREMQDIVDKHLDKRIKLSNDDLLKIRTQITQCINVIKNHHYNIRHHGLIYKKVQILTIDNIWKPTIQSTNKYLIPRYLNVYM